jgi:hypothetical protein
MRLTEKNKELLKRWFRFFVGLLILAGIFAFFSSGYAPPGILGEVLRHNQAHSIDASPLFYSEVENMAELEKDVLRMREKKIEEKRGTVIKNAGIQDIESLP